MKQAQPSWLAELLTPQVEDSSHPIAGTFQESLPIQFSKEETKRRIGKSLACFNRKTPRYFPDIQNCKIQNSMLCIYTLVLYMGTIDSVPANNHPDILQARNAKDLFLLLLYYIYYYIIYIIKDTCDHMCPQSPEEGIRTTGAGITGSWELSDVGAVNQTHVFYKCCTLF